MAEALALVAAIGYLAWISSGTLGVLHWAWDDHIITYTYSRNLAQGHGLRFNAVDPAPTEGYSSLSHVLLVTLGYKFQADPWMVSRGISLVIFWLIPLVVGLALSSLLNVPALGVLACTFGAQILYYLSFSTIYHLQLGMETIIFMGSLACLAGWTLKEFDPKTASSRSGAGRVAYGCLAMAAVVLGRPEGPLLVVLTLALVFLARAYFLPELKGLNDRSFFLVSSVAAFGILAFFLWKKLYFGYFLPNPYYVKSRNAIYGMNAILLPGWTETRAFLFFILPWVAAGIPLFFLARGFRLERKALLLAAVPGALLVLAYAKAIHEAAFQYRYEYPFLVYLYLLLVGLFCLLSKRLRLLPVLLVVAAIASVSFKWQPWGEPAFGLTRWLDQNLDTTVNPYTDLSKDLARTRLGQRATIALSAAGVIPYYSGFRAIDLVGLNDNFLSGRSPHSIAEVWEYIDSFKPDVFQSGLPPASPGIGVDQYDPVLQAPVLRDVLSETGTSLSRYYKRDKVQQMARAEMAYVRDHYTFGGAYQLGTAQEWLLLYVRRDSPHRELILKHLQVNSFSTDRRSDLRPRFGNDPRKL